SPTSIQKNDNVNVVDNNKIVMQVGKESIYESLVKTFLQSYPISEQKKQEAGVKEYIIKQSILLQEGEKQKLIQLNADSYNSNLINVINRKKLVDHIELKISSDSAHIKGKAVVLWFFNQQLGQYPYEEAKKIANQKMSNLYHEVKDGKMTIEQAIDNIKSDESLKKVDKVWKINAELTIDADKNEKIYFDPQLGEILWNLNVGEMTPLMVFKDKVPSPDYKIKDFSNENEKMPMVYIDAVYVFGQVREKRDGTVANFNDWYESIKKSYEIIQY
ncbi:MAG: hypothetical protein WCO06_04140, partial [Candidatus Roizmanbacteria bacterium]